MERVIGGSGRGVCVPQAWGRPHVRSLRQLLFLQITTSCCRCIQTVLHVETSKADSAKLQGLSSATSIASSGVSSVGLQEVVVAHECHEAEVQAEGFISKQASCMDKPAHRNQKTQNGCQPAHHVVLYSLCAARKNSTLSDCFQPWCRRMIGCSCQSMLHLRSAR